MNRRAFLAATTVIAMAARYADAQTATKIFRIGWLTAQRASSLTPFLDAFRSSLAELGYHEQGNLEIEYRYGDDNLLRVAPLAAELARKPVDLLVVQGAAVPLVYELKLPIPAVYVFSGDPVVAGFAHSLTQPRGNMAGLTFMAAELNGKFAPGAFFNAAAGRLRMFIQPVEVNTPDDIERSLSSLEKGVRGVMLQPAPYFLMNAKESQKSLLLESFQHWSSTQRWLRPGGL